MFKINFYCTLFLSALFLNSSNVRGFSNNGFNDSSNTSEQSLFPDISPRPVNNDGIPPLFPIQSSVTPQPYNGPFNGSTNTFMLSGWNPNGSTNTFISPFIPFDWDPNNSTNILNTNSFTLPITHESVNSNNAFASSNNSPQISSVVIAQEVADTNQNNNKRLNEKNGTQEPPKPIFTCHICHKTLKSKDALKYHMKTHDPNRTKDFHCNLCTKSFYQKSALKKHLKIHTGEKRFKCDYCDKWFARKCQKKQHHISHTGEKPFTCAHCSKGFAQKIRWKEHLEQCLKKKQSISNEVISGPPYVCKYCPKKEFMSKSKYVSHIGYHEEKDDSKKCHICKKAYSNKTNLERHNKKQHPET